MEIPPPPVLIERVRELPASGPLLDRLDGPEQVHLVGGAVRDLLRGVKPEPYDLDLVVEGDAAALARRLGPARVHDRFGSSTVALDGFTYDLTRARREHYERPGALPVVEPASLEEDLLRRDFTVNAIAIALNGSSPGHVSSAPDALQDLEARRMRVLHEGSFVDDPTRLLRLARYASRLRFEIEPRTLELALEAARGGALRTVSGARIGSELRLAAREQDPIAAFGELRELELDHAIHEHFGLDDPSLALAAADLLAGDGRLDLLVLGLAARGMSGRPLRELLDGLAFEARDRESITGLATRADVVARALQSASSPSQIAEAVCGAGPEVVALAGALGPAEQARVWLERLRHVRLEIDGHDVAAAGVPEGPAIGVGLRAALAAKLDGAVQGREQELARAVQAAMSG